MLAAAAGTRYFRFIAANNPKTTAGAALSSPRSSLVVRTP